MTIPGALELPAVAARDFRFELRRELRGLEVQLRRGAVFSGARVDPPAVLARGHVVVALGESLAVLVVFAVPEKAVVRAGKLAQKHRIDTTLLNAIHNV